MQNDCSFQEENFWFRFRGCALIRHEDKLLFYKNKNFDFYSTIGGAAHLGETTEECVEREIFEETGLTVKCRNLAAVIENIFSCKVPHLIGTNCHIVEFLYVVEVDDISNCRKTTDENEELKWIPLHELKDYDIKPLCLKENLFHILSHDDIIHLVEKELD